MISKARPQSTGSEQMAVEDAFSGEWFTRYLLDAAFLVVLMLTIVGIALYLDRTAYLRDWSRDLGPGFILCLLVCPMLGVMTLCLAVYAGVRLFRRPHTPGHALVRLVLLAAHVSVFLVCADTLSSTTTTLVASLSGPPATLDPSEAWRAVDSRDFGPDAPPFAPPSGMGLPGLGIPGGGSTSR